MKKMFPIFHLVICMIWECSEINSKENSDILSLIYRERVHSPNPVPQTFWCAFTFFGEWTLGSSWGPETWWKSWRFIKEFLEALQAWTWLTPSLYNGIKWPDLLGQNSAHYVTWGRWAHSKKTATRSGKPIAGPGDWHWRESFQVQLSWVSKVLRQAFGIWPHGTKTQSPEPLVSHALLTLRLPLQKVSVDPGAFAVYVGSGVPRLRRYLQQWD